MLRTKTQSWKETKWKKNANLGTPKIRTWNGIHKEQMRNHRYVVEKILYQEQESKGLKCEKTNDKKKRSRKIQCGYLKYKSSGGNDIIEEFINKW